MADAANAQRVMKALGDKLEECKSGKRHTQAMRLSTGEARDLIAQFGGHDVALLQVSAPSEGEKSASSSGVTVLSVMILPSEPDTE